MIDVLAGTIKEYGIKKKPEAVRNTRKIGKKDMKLNNAMPKMSGEPGLFVTPAWVSRLMCLSKWTRRHTKLGRTEYCAMLLLQLSYL